MRTWIEAAVPLPRILVIRTAAADRDRAGVDIAVVDVPAFLAGISRSAAGQCGHGPIEAHPIAVGKSSYTLRSEWNRDTACRGGERSGSVEGR
jgi:hypothetical protein